MSRSSKAEHDAKPPRRKPPSRGRHWLHIAPYDSSPFPGAESLANSRWQEFARWMVLFGVDFAALSTH